MRCLPRSAKTQGLAAEIHNRLISRPGTFPDLEQMARCAPCRRSDASQTPARRGGRNLSAGGRRGPAFSFANQVPHGHRHDAGTTSPSRLKLQRCCELQGAPFRRWTGKAASQIRAVSQTPDVLEKTPNLARFASSAGPGFKRRNIPPRGPRREPPVRTTRPLIRNMTAKGRS